MESQKSKIKMQKYRSKVKSDSYNVIQKRRHPDANRDPGALTISSKVTKHVPPLDPGYASCSGMTGKNTFEFLLVFLTFNFLLLTFSPNQAHAQEISISTFPTTLHLRAQPSATARSGFTIENKSSDTVTLNIILKPFVPDPTGNGKLKYTEGNSPAILQKVQIFDEEIAINTLELGPKQSKHLSLQVAADEKEPTADYYFSIVFLTAEPNQPEGLANEATAVSAVQAGIAINALLAVGPKELPNGTLEEFSTDFYRNAGPVPFTVKVRNNGTHFMSPQGVILIRNMFGQTVGRIDIKNANILAKTSRTLTGTPYKSSAKDTKDFSSLNSHLSSQNALWPEKFLLGFYTADLSIALSEEGPVLTHSTKFLALPLTFLAGLAIAIIIITLITIRVRRTLKKT